MPFFRRKLANEKQKAPRPLEPSPDLGGRKHVKRTPSNRSAVSLGQADPFNGDLSLAGVVSGGTRPRPTKLLLSSDDLQDTGDLGDSSHFPQSPMRTSSRLSKTFSEIIHDKDALNCFILFMESIKAAHHIRFWLDAESFQASTWSRLRTHSLNSARKGQSEGKSPVYKSCEDEQTDTFKLLGEKVRTQVDLESDSSSSSQNVIKERENLCNSLGEELTQVTSHETTDRKVPQMNAIDNKPIHSAVISDSERTGDLSGGERADEPRGEAEGCEQGKEDGANTISHSSIQNDGNKKIKRGISQEDLAEKLKRSIERDAVKIFTKYLSQDATDPIGVTGELRNETIHKICREDGEVDPQCFLACQEFVFKKMEREYYSDFLVSEYHYKHQINTLTGGKVYLADILYCDGAIFYFMEYMEQEGGSHFLQFLLATDNFQQHLISCEGDYDGMEAQKDAMVLYDKYFSLQATHPLGFDDKIRFEVEGNICREAGPLPDCFAKPRDIVLRTIEKVYFPGYLQSDIYYKYLSELVSTVETANYPPRPRKRAGSDASSEHSSHSASSESKLSRNTYLATDTSHLRNTMSKLDTAMNLDPGLLNPDLLWKRPCPKMTLGKVDTLGEFVSEFAPNPDQEKVKASGLFKRKKTKDKEQEDMALKIAQMIINDVTSVTQTIGAMKNPKEDQEDGS